ncbi:hypothetical protein C8Z91_08450 [Paenibacillus elgii]|uniref:Uncharacterized protein n=1 Tax=Paenibacillus elgii TaxID=189691 RepID=A0A2T6G5K3_9BACL|nr:hypothetical protein [Paenibacillus elgii]PUA39448.1 hypothetical protein C8Z91_08450 [Paenibacillus elgii]
MKVMCKKDVISTENSGIRIQYRKGQIFDAKIIADDLLIKEKDETYSLVGVRGESAADFNHKLTLKGGMSGLISILKLSNKKR